MKRNYIKHLCKMMFTSALSIAMLVSCSKTERVKTLSVAVYVPGIMADSPIYASLAQGVKEAVDEYNNSTENKSDQNRQKASVYIMEAGTNQAEWSSKLTALTATGQYDVIISSNPSLPEIASPISKQFTSQKYIFLDGALEGNNNIACISYNQKEQAYLTGYIASLYSKNHKVGLIAAQEYPVMNNILYPYFEKGAKDADSNCTSDFRIVGNWYDASKGAEISSAMAQNGIDVILPICGGASQGVIQTAKEKDLHIVWFDENGFNKAPGTIISSCMVLQEKAAKEITKEFLEGKTNWGTTKTVGFTEGYIDFIQDDPLYLQYVSESIRNKMSSLINSLKDGSFTVPEH